MKSNPNVKRDVHIQKQINLKRKKNTTNKSWLKKNERKCELENERVCVYGTDEK